MKSPIDDLTLQIAKQINKLKMPVPVAGKCDLRYLIREQRLALQRQVEELQKLETQLNDYFIENLPKSEASGVAGKVARVQLGRKLIPKVGDWDKFYAYVARTKSFDLLQRRLSESAITERWEAKKDVPGVESFTVVTVSCTKLT